MAKKKNRKRNTIMAQSEIPYAKRLKMQKSYDIAAKFGKMNLKLWGEEDGK